MQVFSVISRSCLFVCFVCVCNRIFAWFLDLGNWKNSRPKMFSSLTMKWLKRHRREISAQIFRHEHNFVFHLKRHSVGCWQLLSRHFFNILILVVWPTLQRFLQIRSFLSIKLLVWYKRRTVLLKSNDTCHKKMTSFLERPAHRENRQRVRTCALSIMVGVMSFWTSWLSFWPLKDQKSDIVFELQLVFVCYTIISVVQG